MKTSTTSGTLQRDPKTGRWHVHTRDAGPVDLADSLQTKPDPATADGAEVEATVEGVAGFGGRGYIVTAYHFV